MPDVLTINQGATLSKSIVVYFDGVVFDLTGYEARLQVREKSYADPVISLTSSPAAGLTISDATNGLILVDMLATATDDLSFISGVGQLEIYTTADAIVYRVETFDVVLSKEFTK